MTIIIISYAFRTFKLVVTIFQVSYFIGILFYIYCELVKEIYEQNYGLPVNLSIEEQIEYDGMFFITKWLKGMDSG